jgi:HKD family nuclease
MRTKVCKLIVGCSLYNTHPSFLERWQRHPGFRVILDTTEVFHPKLYLFRVGTEAHLLIGSSNLTGGALRRTERQMFSGTAGRPKGKVWAQWLAEYRAAWQRKQNLAKVARPKTQSRPLALQRPRALESGRLGNISNG